VNLGVFFFGGGPDFLTSLERKGLDPFRNLQNPFRRSLRTIPKP